MFAIFWRTIKDRRTSILAFCIAGIVFLWMYMAIFPTIKEQSENLGKLLEAYPKTLLKVFGVEQIAFTKLEGYLAVEQFGLIWPIMLIFLMVAWAGSSIAEQIEKGTIETLLSLPVSRIKIFFGKYLSGIFSLVSFVIVSVFAVIPMALIYNVDYKLENYATFALLGFMFGLGVLSLSMLLSSIFSEKGKVYFISGGVLILMYVVNILAALKDSLANLKYLSFFYYYNPSNALVYNQIDSLVYWVFWGTAFVCTLLAAIIFSRRDV